MYYDQAMKQPDAAQFAKACDNEIDALGSCRESKDTSRNKSRSVCLGDEAQMPNRHTQGLQKESSPQYPRRQTGVPGALLGDYTPVVQWTSIRMCLILSVLQNWRTRQLDFVLAYPQADVETKQYIEMPKGFDVGGKSRASHVLKLLKKINGGKAASRIWVEHLKKDVRAS
jgi:hypothetical protein